MASVKLTDEQKQQVAQWAAEGADLNQIQDRLRDDFGISLMFMDVRFLVADLGVVIGSRQEPEPEPEAPTEGTEDVNAEPVDEMGDPYGDPEPMDTDELPGASSVEVVVDTIAIPGALASGKVTFSDGVKAQWYLDQMGRLGLSGVERTYQPPPQDMAAFQGQLRQALRRMGY